MYVRKFYSCYSFTLILVFYYLACAFGNFYLYVLTICAMIPTSWCDLFPLSVVGPVICFNQYNTVKVTGHM